MNVQTNLTQPRRTLLAMKRPEPRQRGMPRLVWVLAAMAAVAIGFVAIRYLYPRTVETFAVVPAAMTVDFRGPGTLDATNKIALSSRVQGRILDIAVDRNDRVTKGQILARLESSALAGEVEAAEASARAAERAVEAAEADRERAKAVFTNAKANYERQMSLAEKGVTSQAGIDAAVAAFRQAEADLARTERAIDQARAAAQSAAAKARVAQAQLDDAVVRAPFNGIVVSRDRNVGDILTAGTSILQLFDPATIVLTARFDESAIAAMQPRQPVAISFASQPGREAPGHVMRLGRLVDQETREFTVDVALDSLPPNWALGQRGTARVSVETLTDVLSVPKPFIARRDGQLGVWVAESGRARWRAVEVGTSGHGRVEIRKGLVAGQTALKPEGLYPFMKTRLSGGST